jgi:phage-related protein
MRVGFTQVSEKVGLALLPVFEKLTNFVIDQIFPAFDKIGAQFAGITGQIGEAVVPAFQNLVSFFQDYLVPVFQTWWGFIQDVVIPGIVNFFTPVIKGLQAAFSSVSSTLKDNQANLAPLFNLFKGVFAFVSKYLAPVIGNVLGVAFNVLGKAISAVVTIFANLVGLIDSAVRAVKALASALANSVVGKAVSGIAGGISSVFGGGRASGGSVTGGTSYLVGEKGAELFTPGSSGTITPNGGLGGNTYNINVTGAIDPESVSRQIVDILNRSQARGTQGASNLAFTGA